MQTFNERLPIEINLLKHSLYSLSEQEKGDLGLMLPKIFIEARNDSIARGFLKDQSNDNLIILEDDEGFTNDSEA